MKPALVHQSRLQKAREEEMQRTPSFLMSNEYENDEELDAERIDEGNQFDDNIQPNYSMIFQSPQHLMYQTADI